MHPTNKLVRRKIKQDIQRSEKTLKPRIPKKGFKYPKKIFEKEIDRFRRNQLLDTLPPSEYDYLESDYDYVTSKERW